MFARCGWSVQQPRVSSRVNEEEEKSCSPSEPTNQITSGHVVVEVWAWLHSLHPNILRRFPTVEHRGKLTCSEHGLYYPLPSDKEVCAEVLLHCVPASDEVCSV